MLYIIIIWEREGKLREVEGFSKVTQLLKEKQQSWDLDSRARALPITPCFLREPPGPRHEDEAAVLFLSLCHSSLILCGLVGEEVS